MEKNNNDILKFFYKQKYILIFLLIVSLTFSYFIQKNIKIDKQTNNENVIFTDYNYQIWYLRHYGSGINRILGAVFEIMGIEEFLLPKKEQIPNPMSTNKYNYFKLRTVNQINKKDFFEIFETQKKIYIEKEIEFIKNFRTFKKNNNILNEREFKIFKIKDAKINIKEIKRVRETSMDYAEKIISQLNGSDKNRSENIQLIIKDNKIGTKNKFYYPEIIILLIYIGYFFSYFFVKLIREDN